MEVLEIPGVAVTFHPRPREFQKAFPDPDKFQKKGGSRGSRGSRRLEEETDDKVQHLEADDGGLHFDLDFAGAETEVRVIDLDETPQLDGLACSSSHHMYLHWDSTGFVIIHKGDVLVGGMEWQCRLDPYQGQGPEESESFLVEVLSVDSKPDAAARVTKLRVRETSVPHDFPIMLSGDGRGGPGKHIPLVVAAGLR